VRSRRATPYASLVSDVGSAAMVPIV
jgi:hypothetical protein